MTVTLSPPRPAEERVEDRHWTVEEFYRAATAGAFHDPDRLEIIHGRIVEKMPQGDLHLRLRRRVSRRLRTALEPRFFPCEECPLHIAFDGEPIPDVLLMREEEYVGRHPSPEDVVLVVEVSDTTVAYDLGGKADLYAQAGVTDYWVVLVNELAVVRHRRPTPDGYGEVVRLEGQETISPLAAPDAVWAVDALLGREEQAGETCG